MIYCIYTYICIHICILCGDLYLFICYVNRLINNTQLTDSVTFYSIYSYLLCVCSSVSSKELFFFFFKRQPLWPSLYLQTLPHDSHVSIFLGRVQEVRPLKKPPWRNLAFILCYLLNHLCLFIYVYQLCNYASKCETTN